MFGLCVFLLCLVYDAAVQGQAVSESCRVQGLAGACTRRIECEAFTNNVDSSEDICRTKGNNSVVCCLRGISTTTARPVATTPRLGTTTTEYIPPVYDYQTNFPEVEECAPLRSDQTAAKIGRKAWDNCIDYHEQLVRPCQRSAALLGGVARANNCMHNDEVFVGSSSVLRDEVSHVALLGYELANSSRVWRCSGTLLSDHFILTAAHCKFGGIRITLDQWTVPACLDVFGGEYSKAIALSWSRSKADIVKKVSLNEFTIKQYQRLRDERGMKFRLNTTTQICYGSYTLDTDQRDAFGPLVIKNPRINCMYSVIGVASLAQRSPRNPGVFTKVAHFVPWIESVVWP